MLTRMTRRFPNKAHKRSRTKLCLCPCTLLPPILIRVAEVIRQVYLTHGVWVDVSNVLHSASLPPQVAEVIRQVLVRLTQRVWINVPRVLRRAPSLQVAEVIRQVLVRLTQAYSDHMLWSCAAVTRSANAHRRSLAAEMLRSVRQGCGKDRAGAELRGRIEAFAALADQLIRLCHWQPPPARGSARTPTEASVATEFAALLRALPVDVSGGGGGLG